MIVVYMRVSTDEQRENQSIELQRQEMMAFCADRKYHDVECIEDDGFSGTIPLADRPGGARLLSLLASGQVERVLLWAADRLGRAVGVLVTAMEHIDRSKAVLESKREGVLSLKDTSKILMTCVQMGMAAQERGMISDRVRTRYFQLAAKGRPTGGKVLFGFTTSADKKEVIQPKEAETVEHAFKLASTGMSNPKLSAELNRLGMLNRGSQWTPKRINKLLINPTYKGEYWYGKLAPVILDGKKLLRATPRDQWKSRACPGIVSPQLWEQANAAMRRNQNVAMAHPKRDYLLRGLIRCGCCGLKYVSTSVGTHTDRYYYRCHGSRAAAGPYGKKGLRCPAKSLVGPVVERLVWLDLQRYITKPGEAIEALRKKLALRDRERPIAEDIAQIKKRLASREQVRRNFQDQHAEGLISMAALKERLMQLNTEQIELQKQLTALTARARDTQANLHQLQSVEAMLRGAQKILKASPGFEARRKIVEALVKEIVVDPKEGTIVSYVFPATADRGQKSLPLNQSVLRSIRPPTTYSQSRRRRTSACAGFRTSSPGTRLSD